MAVVQEYSKAKIQSMIMTDLVFRSPLWALLILAIYGVIMGAAMWFLICVVKPSVDRKMHKGRTEKSLNSKYKSGEEFIEYRGYVRGEIR